MVDPETNLADFINYYSVAFGLLKTAATSFAEGDLGSKIGAEIIVQLIANDKGRYVGDYHLEPKIARQNTSCHWNVITLICDTAILTANISSR